jgi:hypothetical protein
MLQALYILVIFAGVLLPLNVRGAEMSLAKDEVGQLWIQIIGRIDEGDDLKFRGILVDEIKRIGPEPLNCHLDHESALNFIPWLRALDKGQARVDGDLGNSAQRQASGCD